MTHGFQFVIDKKLRKEGNENNEMPVRKRRNEEGTIRKRKRKGKEWKEEERDGRKESCNEINWKSMQSWNTSEVTNQSVGQVA